MLISLAGGGGQTPVCLEVLYPAFTLHGSTCANDKLVLHFIVYVVLTGTSRNVTHWRRGCELLLTRASWVWRSDSGRDWSVSRKRRSSHSMRLPSRHVPHHAPLAERTCCSPDVVTCAYTVVMCSFKECASYCMIQCDSILAFVVVYIIRLTGRSLELVSGQSTYSVSCILPGRIEINQHIVSHDL